MFLRTSIVVVVSAWLAAAQGPSNSSTHHTLAAFAFVRTGERTPILRNDTQILTTLGAQQMYALGENFRMRYIAGDSPQRLGVERIAGLSVDTIDNDQIWVQTLDKPHLVSSAQAFMQGLYPPHSISNGTGKAASLLADGSHIDYPLNGYQYASIQTASEEDPDSRYISGSQNCPMAQVAALNYFTTEEFKETETANADLFKKLNLAWLDDTLPEAYFNARSALEIADYISYQYAHNFTIYEALSSNDSDYTGVYDRLRYLADEVAWHLYASATDVSTDSNNQLIGGKTLASSILDSFRLQIAGDGSSGDNSSSPSHPLTFYFGEQDAMMGLASLLKLDSDSPHFKSIPSYGSVMVFELFSSSSSAEQPTTSDDLWVRFSFHNATDPSAEELLAYPMFGNGPSKTDMQWSEFESLFSSIAMASIADWCNTCNSASLFCRGAAASPKTDLDAPSSMQMTQSRLSPVIGGIIGAFVSLVVAGLCFALVMLFGGIRFHRVQRPNHANNKPTRSGLGGFKGSAKLASDTDLVFPPNAAAAPGIVSYGKGGGHERIDSWELNQKEFGRESARGSEDGIDARVTNTVDERRVQPFERI